MTEVYTLSVFLHILAAIVWIGGALFLVFVLVPVVRKPEMRSLAPVLLGASGRRFKIVGWVSLVVLVLTGFASMGFRGWMAAMSTPGYWQSPVGKVLALKLGLVAVILLLSVIHDFYVGSKAVDRMKEAPDAADTKRLRKLASWMGRINVLLGLVVVYLAVMLVRGMSF